MSAKERNLAIAIAVLCHGLSATVVIAQPPGEPPDAALRDRYFDAIQTLNRGEADKAIAELDAITRELGKRTARVQAALIHALAAVKEDPRLLYECKMWATIAVADASANTETERLCQEAQQRVDEAVTAQRKNAERILLERRSAEQAERSQRDAAFSSAHAVVVSALASSFLNSSFQAIDEAHEVAARYPDDPRSKLLLTMVPTLEQHIEDLKAQAQAQAQQAAALQSARYLAAAEDESSQATSAYALGTMWLVLGLGSGAGAIFWLSAEPLGDDTVAVVLPGCGFGMIAGYSLFSSYADFEQASYHDREADRLRDRAALDLRVSATGKGPSFAMSGSF